MDKSVFKVFFSKEKESNWLNRLGKEGYLLDSVNDSKYRFIKHEGEVFYYSIEYLDCSPRSDEANIYFKSREELGITPILASGNWVYFVSKQSEIQCTEEICKKNSKVYFWRSLYLLFFSICGSVFCGYHIFAASLLQNLDQAGNGQLDLLATNSGFAILNVLKSGFNYVIKAINAYFRIWTSIFGENDAVAVVSALVPFVLILLIIATFNIDSYICYFKKRKALQNAAAAEGSIIETNREVDSEVLTDGE